MRVFVILLLSLLAGCTFNSHSPPARFYILPHPQAAEPVPQLRQVIGIAPVKLPRYLDRPQIVTLTDSGEIQLAEFHRWAEPLAAGFTRVLSAGLRIRLPASHIVLLPVRYLKPDWTLEIQVHDFLIYRDHCRLLVGWRLRHGNETLSWQQEDIRQPVRGSGYRAIVTAMSSAIDILAGRIVRKLGSA